MANYKVQTDTLLEETGRVYLGGRINGTSEYTTDFEREGYWLSLDTSGNWELFRKDHGSKTTLSSGSITGFGVNLWKTLALEFNGDRIKAYVGDVVVADLYDSNYPNGNTAIGTTDWGNSNWVSAQFDNFAVSAVSGPTQTTIIDNGDAGYSETGAWSASGLTGYNGSGSRYSSSAGAFATWTPTIAAAGKYKVFVMYPAHVYSDQTAQYTVNYQGGSQVFNVNQEQNGSSWVELGDGTGFNFAAGSSANVKLEVTKPGNNEEVVRADAVRFVRVNSFEAESLPVSTSAGDAQANYADSSTSRLFNSLNSNAVNDYVEYTVNVPESGTYTVYAANRTANNKGIYQLTIDGSNQGGTVDQYSSGVGFTESNLGTFTFGTAGHKTFRFTVVGKNSSSSGYTLGYDYIKLVKN